MAITKQQIKGFKAKAHHLKPVVIVGQNGLTDNVFNEIDGALEHHELIKVKIAQDDRQERVFMAEYICQRLLATEVGIVGKTVILYRKSQKK